MLSYCMGCQKNAMSENPKAKNGKKKETSASIKMCGM